MCAQAKHSPSHTVDLYSPLFGRLRGAPPHLAPLRWVSIRTSLHGQPPLRSSSDLCSLLFFFFLSMFIFKVVSDLVRGHRRPHKLLELMFSCCVENPLDYNLVLCSGNLPTSTQICFDFLNLVPSSERNTFWWRNKTCIHSWWSPCWNNNRYHADRVFFVSGKKKMRVNMLFSAVSFNKSLVYNLWKPKTAVMCIMWRSVAAFKTNRR